MRKSNYDKFPFTPVDGKVILGWDSIVRTLQEEWAMQPVWAVDLYVGTYEVDFMEAFKACGRRLIDTRSLMWPEERLRRLTARFITDDVLFGHRSNVELDEYFDPQLVDRLRARMDAGEGLVVVGTGAACLVRKRTSGGASTAFRRRTACCSAWTAPGWSSPRRTWCSPTPSACWASVSGPASARSFPFASISSTPWGEAT